MNTPAHLIFAAAAFARPNNPKTAWAAITGALIPDLSLYLMAGWSLNVQGNSPQYVFNTQYFSDEWQRIFAIDNSFFLWIGIIALAFWIKREWLWALGGAGFLHICLDFPLHHDDGRMHFWPFSDWIFHSPVSYWDSSHYGNIVAPIETALVLLFAVVLFKRFRHSWWSYSFAALALMQVAPFIIFSLMFS